jgi:tetratricopeptide (TPR) repeat protein
VVLVALAAGTSRANAAGSDDDGKDAADKPSAFRRWLSLPVDRERDAARQIAPRRLNRGPAATDEARVLRLRLYADRDYRGVVLHWRAKAQGQIDKINGVVGPIFGVRFQIESAREWDKSHVGQPLSAVIDDLEALDPGREVDCVIGLATPLRGVATSAHQVGLARLLARHFVMRGMDDEEEALALERDYKLLPPDERIKLYADRKGHKEIVMFLHEWGHTLGLLHHEDRTGFMNPAYDPREVGFTDFEKEVIALVVERRLEQRDVPYPETADLIPLLERAPSDEGSDKDRADLLDFARRRARASAGAGGAAEAAPLDLNAGEIDAFNRAVAAVNGGHRDEAWKALAPVVERAAHRKVGAATWLRLAHLAAGAGALTAADDAATRAGLDDPDALKLAASIESTRHRIALPLDSAKRGVPPEREPAYVAAFDDVEEAIYGRDPQNARARLHDFAAAFPGAPGADVLACDAELHAKRPAVAAKSCQAALDKFKGATRAYYLLGLIEVGARKPAQAEQHLHQAILMDPSDPNPWRALARIYRDTHNRHALSELDARHQALFQAPLPRD